MAGLGDDLHSKLASVGLVAERASARLGDYLDGYLTRRQAGRVKGATMTNLVTVTNDVRRYFGEAADCGPSHLRMLTGSSTIF